MPAVGPFNGVQPTSDSVLRRLACRDTTLQRVQAQAEPSRGLGTDVVPKGACACQTPQSRQSDFLAQVVYPDCSTHIGDREPAVTRSLGLGSL